jgi:hypothetical protein
MSEPRASVTGPGPAGPPWWALLPPADAQVSCGDAAHRLRWEDGRLTALDHPDAEGELVLAALGGDRSRCVDLVESWGRRSDDLEVLAVGPRSAADELTITAETADAPAGLGAPRGRGWFAYAPLTGRAFSAQRPWPWARGPRPMASMLAARARFAGAGWRGPVGRPGATVRRAGSRPMSGRRARWQQVRDQASRAAERREELFSLLALGAEFQMRLSAAVAAGWADGGSRAGGRETARPALIAALAARLGPAVQAWLGIDPGRVDVSLHQDAGWGRLAPSCDRFDAALPVGWLASVWAPGLAVIAGHLIVAVTEAAWPDATVLGVPGPGADPVILKVRATDGGWIRAEGAR